MVVNNILTDIEYFSSYNDDDFDCIIDDDMFIRKMESIRFYYDGYNNLFFNNRTEEYISIFGNSYKEVYLYRGMYSNIREDNTYFVRI
jgi:hypothetical protein